MRSKNINKKMLVYDHQLLPKYLHLKGIWVPEFEESCGNVEFVGWCWCITGIAIKAKRLARRRAAIKSRCTSIATFSSYFYHKLKFV